MIAYAISDPSTLNFQTLQQDIKRFSKKADMILYRDKDTKNYADNAKRFIQESQKESFSKVLLHRDYKLASKFNANRVHLTSTQFEAIDKAKALGLFVVISTHTKQEALKAQRLGADMITYSPIFATPNKGVPKGVEKLRELISLVDIPVIALGGIVTQEQIDLCKKSGAVGFASIRYFA